MKRLILFTIILSAVLCSCGNTDAHSVTLMYHEVSDDIFSPSEELFVSPADFERQLIALNERGIGTVFASETPTADGTFAVLTFDDGYEGIYKNVFPLLKKYNAHATVFLITSKFGEEHHLTEDEVREMAASGLVEFGSHTVTHRRLTELDDEETAYELRESARIISGLTGRPVTSLAYPNGAYDERVITAARKLGYTVGYTIDSTHGKKDELALSRYTVWRETGDDAFAKYIDSPF